MHRLPLSSLMLEHLQELLNSAGGHLQTLLLKWLNFFFTHFKRHIYILSVWVNDRARREIEVVRKKPQSILIPRGQSDSGQVPLPMSQHWGNISLLWGWCVSWNPVVFFIHPPWHAKSRSIVSSQVVQQIWKLFCLQSIFPFGLLVDYQRYL